MTTTTRLSRTHPGYIGNEADDDAIRPLIARLESTRRRLDAAGLIDPARCTIHAEHGLDLDDLQYLAEMSPFVPQDRTGPCSPWGSRGF